MAWSVAQGIATGRAASREDARRVVEVDHLGEQVGLLRQLLNAQADRRDDDASGETKRAIITALGGAESGSTRGIERHFSLRNVGTAVALELEIWLALDSGGTPSTAASSSTATVGALMPGDPEREVVVEQPAPFLGGKVPRDGYVIGHWKEPDGAEHTAALAPTTVYV